MKRTIPSLLVTITLLVAAAPAVAQRPAGYPRSYDQLIADARAERQVRIYANADRAEMMPVVAAFRRRYPGIAILYADLGSTEIYRRFVTETRARRPSADLVWSSAMDLQVKLINDGFAQGYASPEKPALPPTALWKNMGFGVTAEPIGIVYNRRLVPGPRVPRTHAALEALLRQQRRYFTGRVTTFDPARSNVGYLYLSEDFATTGAMRASVRLATPSGTSTGNDLCRNQAPTIRPSVTTVRNRMTIEKRLRNSRS